MDTNQLDELLESGPVRVRTLAPLAYPIAVDENGDAVPQSVLPTGSLGRIVGRGDLDTYVLDADDDPGVPVSAVMALHVELADEDGS